MEGTPPPGSQTLPLPGPWCLGRLHHSLQCSLRGPGATGSRSWPETTPSGATFRKENPPAETRVPKRSRPPYSGLTTGARMTPRSSAVVSWGLCVLNLGTGHSFQWIFSSGGSLRSREVPHVCKAQLGHAGHGGSGPLLTSTEAP